MEIVKPFYVSYHQNRKDCIISGIYSIDIHPSGKKYVTSGGSDTNGIISIWNMEAIRSKAKEKDENIPKLLFSDSSHLKCVNVAKWSPNGKYLASGSVDSLIFIWVQRKISELEGNNKKYLENYRTAYQLRGHISDVIDIAWSPQGNYLASAGIDNKIIVWNVDKLPEKTAILSGHTGIVKGLSWDPLCRYLASESEDLSLRIWRTSDWKEEISLKEEMDKGVVNCSFSRISWSPDGMNIVATGTHNNGAPSCQLYYRDNWKKGVDMIGHRQHLFCARFFPALLKHPKTNKEYILLAMGGKDRSLSLWTTFRNRPFKVLTDLFTDTIYDITWNAETMEMMACSLDGSLTYIRLKPEIFGTPFTKMEMSEYLAKTHGRDVVKDNLALSKSNTDKFVIPESSAVLKLQLTQIEMTESKYGVKSSLASIQLLDSKKPTGPKEQIIKKAESGKRRITPRFLNHIDEDDIETEACANGVSPPKIPCPCPTKSNNQSEKADNNSIKISTKTKTALEEKFRKPDSPAGNESIDENAKEKVKIKKDETSTAVVNKTTAKSSDPVDPGAQAVEDIRSRRNGSLYKDTIEKLCESTLLTKNLPKIPTISSLINSETSSSSSKKKDTKSSLSLTQKSTVTHQLKLRQSSVKHNSSVLCLLPGESHHYVVKITHETTTNQHNLQYSKITVNILEQKLWDISLTQLISVIVNFKDKLYVGDISGRLHIFNLRGGRYISPIILDSGITSIICNGKYLFVVTCSATLYLCSIGISFKLVLKESFQHLLSINNDSIRSLNMLGDNVGLVLDSGSSYLLNRQMGLVNMWQPITSHNNALESWSSLHLANKDLMNQPLGAMQNQHGTETSISSDHLIELSSLSTSTKLNLIQDYLECQVLLCESIESPEEYKYWLLLWVRHLIESGNSTRVRDICNRLLGPINQTTKSSWDPYILKLSKHQILNEILPLFALNLQLQGLYTEIKDQLEMLGDVTVEPMT